MAGLSHARNAGIAASCGRFILWTDDDVVVDEDGLSTWFTAFRRRPRWRCSEGAPGPSTRSRAITPQRVPFGLGYAIRGEEQRSHLYDPRLGVAPVRRQGGEETAVVRAILASGGTGRWERPALVYHLMPAERQTTA